MPTNNTRMGEMIPKRTPNSKTWINLDGSYTTEIFKGQVHFEDEHGNLQNINTNLMDESDLDTLDVPVSREGKGKFREARIKAKERKAKNNLDRDDFDYQGLFLPFELKVPKNFKRGYTIGKGADKLTFKPVKASPAKGFVDEARKNVIHYQDVWNDTDVSLEVTPSGIKETLYLKTDRAPAEFSFEVAGNLTEDLTTEQMRLEPAWLIDAAGERRDVTQVLAGEGNKKYIKLTADVAGLVYPIELDPTVTIQPDAAAGKDAYVYSNAAATNYGTDQYLQVGNQGAYMRRSYVQFDLSGIPASVVVTSAIAQLYYNGGYGTAIIDIGISKVTGTWTETGVTWNNQPAYSTAMESTRAINRSNEPVGYKDFTATNLVKDIVNGAAVNNGFVFRISTEGFTGPDAWALFYSSDATNVAQRPKLVVTYNQKPGRPNILAPNGGENWNAEHVISWAPATDADTAQSLLQYQVDLSLDDGATWKVLKALTAPGATSLTYDFTNEPETSLASISIRAYDGVSYGDWDESTGVFTIQHNHAPTAPSNLSPNGGVPLNRAQPVRLSWLHNDPNASDPQSKYDLQWRKKGNAAWTAVTAVSVNQFHDLTGLTHGEHEWRVRTYDQAGLLSPYSDIALFLAGDKPAAATIVSPGNGAIVAVANPTIQWSSADQAAYKLNVKDAAGAIVWSDEKVSVNKAVTANANLANQQAYTLELSIRNADGLWSDVIAIGVNVSYTPPAVPIQFRDESQPSVVVLSIDNPVPTGTEPIVASNEVYRKKVGETDWLRIGKELLRNGTFTDYTPVPNKLYEYKVRAWGENGTYRDSVIATNSTTLEHAELALISNYEERVQLEYNTDTSQDKEYRRTLTQFAGRKFAMAEFSPEEKLTLATDYILKTREELERFYDMVDKKETLLYRDREGRHAYITIGSVGEKEIGFGQFFGISFTMDRVYVREGV